MKVKVDHDLCTGDGVCAEICPEVFKMNDDDLAVVIVDVVPTELESDCEEAAETCPEQCIHIEK